MSQESFQEQQREKARRMQAAERFARRTPRHDASDTDGATPGPLPDTERFDVR